MGGNQNLEVLKPIDKVSLGEITSHRAVTTVNAQRRDLRVPRQARESCDIVHPSLRTLAASVSYHLAFQRHNSFPPRHGRFPGAALETEAVKIGVQQIVARWPRNYKV
jgi:hypothetical protein